MSFSTARKGYASDTPAISCADVLSASPYVVTSIPIHLSVSCICRAYLLFLFSCYAHFFSVFICDFMRSRGDHIDKVSFQDWNKSVIMLVRYLCVCVCVCVCVCHCCGWREGYSGHSFERRLTHRFIFHRKCESC